MDKLFLLKPSFCDPEFEGRRFYCWHCALIEGVLSMYPILREKLEVKYTEWPRPRTSIISEGCEGNESLPLLVIADGKTSKFQTGFWKGRFLISNKDAILSYLSEEYGIPEPHP